jgi:general secretion pathway protein A
MYEEFYGLCEKPFSLTPDPRYFYRSDCHVNALELVEHGIRRREGVVVITGTSGTGKTTLCRTILEEVDRKTFTSLVLNPYISEEDLLRVILQDFGVISLEETRRGRSAGLHPKELILTLYEFLRSLPSLGARALVIIDEAQKLPLQVLEQVQRLSGLTRVSHGSETLLQIVLVGQLNLINALHARELRQLDDRVLIRYRLRNLTAAETVAYVRHRLAIAGNAEAFMQRPFTRKALRCVYRATQGNPRLVNLVCDRALVSGYANRAVQVEPESVVSAANALGLEANGSAAATFLDWMRRRVA